MAEWAAKLARALEAPSPKPLQDAAKQMVTDAGRRRVKAFMTQTATGARVVVYAPRPLVEANAKRLADQAGKQLQAETWARFR